jgi:WD40 repeat protein
LKRGREKGAAAKVANSLSMLSYLPNDDMLVAVRDESIYVLDRNSGEILNQQRYAFRPSNLTVSPSGSSLAFSTLEATDTYAVHIVGVQQPDSATIFSLGRGIMDLGFSFDGSRIAVGGENGMVEVWDLAGPRKAQSFGAHASSVEQVQFSSQGDLLAALHEDGSIRLLEVESGIVYGIFAMLPGGQWIFYDPDNLSYTASSEGDTFATVTRGDALGDTQPLANLREKLRVTDFEAAKRKGDQVNRIQPNPN